MTINIENNVFAEIGAWLTSWTNLLNIKGWKETLFPPAPFVLNLVKFNSIGTVLLREIVNVTSKTWNIFTITRAYEPVPVNDSALTTSQIAYDFDEGDMIYMTFTAWMFENMDSSISWKLDKTWWIMTGILSESKSIDIASASTTNLSTATGNIVNITGTTTITSFGTIPVWTRMILKFTSSLTITHNATSLILPTNTDIVTQTWDWMYIIWLWWSNIECIWYQRKNWQALISTADITWLLEVNSPWVSDYFLEYNASAWSNKKISFNNLKSSISKKWWDWSDWIIDWSADINLSWTDNSLIVKQYSSFATSTKWSQAYTNDPASGTSIVLNMTSTSLFAIGDFVKVSSSAWSELAKVSAVVLNTSITVDVLALNHTTTTPVVTRMNKFTVTPNNCIVYIKVQWNFDATNWVFDFAWKWAPGWNSQVAWSQWTSPFAFPWKWWNAGWYDSAPSAQTFQVFTKPPFSIFSDFFLWCWSGGGWGWNSQFSTYTWWLWGGGGWCLVIEADTIQLWTAVTWWTTWHTFMFQWLAWQNKSGWGPGGGGAWWSLFLLYKASILGTATYNTTWWLGGTGAGIWWVFAWAAANWWSSMINTGWNMSWFVSWNPWNTWNWWVWAAGFYSSQKINLIA